MAAGRLPQQLERRLKGGAGFHHSREDFLAKALAEHPLTSRHVQYLRVSGRLNRRNRCSFIFRGGFLFRLSQRPNPLALSLRTFQAMAQRAFLCRRR